jgi:hypothetical protein
MARCAASLCARGLIKQSTAELARMLGHDPAVLADCDAIGVRTSTGRPTALATSEYLLLSKHTRWVFETDAGTAWHLLNTPA